MGHDGCGGNPRKHAIERRGSDCTDNSGKDDPIWKQIEDIIQAQGMFSNGLFQIEIDRNDINYVTLHSAPILPSFQINGTLFFEKLADGPVGMNADMALKPSEIDHFIDQLIGHGIVFQAEHQHFYDFQPLV